VQPIADGLRLLSAAIIQVALGGTVSDSKIGRIAGAGCERVTYHQNVAAGLHFFNHSSLI
jgi:hypothetical protein